MSEVKEGTIDETDYRMSVDTMREVGRALSITDGSTHYNYTEVQPLDLAASIGQLEGFCIVSAIKYASRFGVTRNKKDLIKAVDLLQVLLGYLEIQSTQTTKE